MAGPTAAGVLRLMGPAFLVSVAYLDPGNWATAVEAGSRFGYRLIWVVVASNLIAILLQSLAARLGLVTGKHLAEVCREQYPVNVCFLLWIICEVSIVALDLTMVLGTAIGLNMLFRLPVLPCIVLTSLDAVMVFFAVPRTGFRWSEVLTACLVGLVFLCFLVDVVLSAPPLGSVVQGMWPRLERDSLYTAVSLLGANVMPHNFYLHSALVKGRGHDGQSMDVLCYYNFIDVTCALGIALLINLAVLIVSASTFFSAGIVVETLQDAHDLMEQALGSRVAPAIFGLALLLAGQLSTFTGTIAGQVVLKGFLNIEMSPWLRRLTTRAAAIVPAAILHQYYGDKGTYRMLVIAQVVLALQLPFTLIPLIKATSERKLMGRYANGPVVQFFSWGSTVLIFLASLMLFVSLFLPADDIHPGSTSTAGLDLPSQLNQWLSESSDTAWRSPIRLIVVVLMVVSASSMLLLLLWMVVTPFAHGLTNETLIPLFSKQIDWESQNASVKREHLRQRYADQPIGSAKEEIMCASEVAAHEEQEGGGEAPQGWRAMTRGGRRLFSSTLDKFWGQYYDLHGRQIGPYPENGILDAILECREAIKKIEGLPSDHPMPPWQAVDETLNGCLEAGSFSVENLSVSDKPGYVFGLWCLVRLLELCQSESRPELWGRYALVLNRLQWILPTLTAQAAEGDRNGGPLLLDVINMLDAIESWIKERKGPKGTGAGEVAFPKGKEIIMSVTKRYRRHLGITQDRQKRKVERSLIGVALSGLLFFFSVLTYTNFMSYNQPTLLAQV